ncbi:MAG: hypothetical protein HQL31_11230, partial [Planctomycetes bacterium]|nr:hypothetical protein [Planctomycetota bacterium]
SAILAIFVALLVPSLSKSLEWSRMLVCDQNEKQIFLAFTTFAADNRGWSPPRGRVFMDKSSAPTWYWHDFLFYEMDDVFSNLMDANGYPGFSELKADAVNITQSNEPGFGGDDYGPSGILQYHNRSVFDCPSSLPSNTWRHTQSRQGMEKADYLPGYTDGNFTLTLPSYAPWAPGSGRWRDSVSGSKDFALPRLHALVYSPAKKVLILDAGMDKAGWLTSAGIDRYPASMNGGVGLDSRIGVFGYNVTPRHMGGSQAIFLDGHVEHLADIDGVGKLDIDYLIFIWNIRN